MELLTIELNKYAVQVLGSSSVVPFVTMVMLVGSGEDKTAPEQAWSMEADDAGNINVVLRGLAPCEKFVSATVQRRLRSCYWDLAAEVQNHFINEVGLAEENAILAAEGMKSTHF